MDNKPSVSLILDCTTNIYQQLLNKRTWLSDSKKSALIFSLASDEDFSDDDDSEDKKPPKTGRNTQRQPS